MGKLLRLLGFYICVPIYTTIPKIYEIFYYLANSRFLKEGVINTISSNIYVLVSVVMLFAFSATMLSAIVNPDLIEDKKKGIGAIFKRAAIGIILIVAIPFAFDKAYEYQKQIMDSHLIEKILVGMNFKTDAYTGGNGGKVIAGNMIASVIYPNVENEDDEITVEDVGGRQVANTYKSMVENIDNMSDFDDFINAHPQGNEDKYAFEFNGLIAIIAGLAADYLLLMFAIDMAVRMFKLAFFEMTAPISVISYIAAGEDTLKKWISEVGKTFLDVFVRLAAMAFFLFFLSQLNNFFDTSTTSTWAGGGVSWKLLLKLLIIIGMLIFVKKVPDLVKKAFGFDISSSGGIRGRLGEMAGVGKQAQAAWDKMKQAGKVLAPAAVMAASPIGWLGAGAAIGGNQLWKRKLSDTKFGEGVRDLASDAKKAGKYAGAFLGAGSLGKGIKEVSKIHGESASGKHATYERGLADEQRIKDDLSDLLRKALSGILPEDLYDIDPKTGKKKLNMDRFLSSGKVKPEDFAAMTTALQKNNIISSKQGEIMADYNKKQNAYMEAQQNELRANEIKTMLDNAMKSTSDAGAKQRINDVITQLTGGGFTSDALKQEIGSLRASDIISDVSSSRISTLVDTITSSGKDSRGNILSSVTLNAKTSDASNDFDRINSKLDTVIENASSAKNKEAMKEMRTRSKKMSEKNNGVF